MKEGNEKRIKSNEDMKSAEDEFIAQMREQLRVHEEAYVPGAWERFSQKESKSRKLVLWTRYAAGAAAVLLLSFGMFMYQQSHDNTATTVMNSKKTDADAVKSAGIKKSAPDTIGISDKRKGSQGPLQPSDPIYRSANGNTSSVREVQPVTSGGSPRLAQAEYSGQLQDSHILPQSNEPYKAAPQQNITVGKNELLTRHQVSSQNIVPSDSISRSSAKDVKPPVVLADQKKEIPKKSFEDFLKEESVREQSLAVKNKKKEDKWEMGVMVAPSFGNAKRLNMGYGVSMAYALSDKVSIGSGVAYNEMGATKGTVTSSPAYDAPAMVSLASSSRSLQSVDARLTGIDIPLEIKYRFSKALYANVGLSAFAVLDQKQQNNFIENNVEAEFAGFAGTADATFRTVVVSRKVSEDIPQEQVKEARYLGFYNFSFGYQQKVFGGKSFAVEPFVKLPVKEFSRENLYLIGTGVKLRFDF